MDKLKAFGERIRVERERLGLSQREVGRKIGRTENFLQGVENGERWIRLDAAVALANLFGVDLGWLSTGEGPRSKSPLEAATTPAEAECLQKFRRLRPAAQRWVLASIDLHDRDSCQC